MWLTLLKTIISTLPYGLMPSTHVARKRLTLIWKSGRDIWLPHQNFRRYYTPAWNYTIIQSRNRVEGIKHVLIHLCRHAFCSPSNVPQNFLIIFWQLVRQSLCPVGCGSTETRVYVVNDVVSSPECFLLRHLRPSFSLNILAPWQESEELLSAFASKAKEKGVDILYFFDTTSFQRKIFFVAFPATCFCVCHKSLTQHPTTWMYTQCSMMTGEWLGSRPHLSHSQFSATCALIQNYLWEWRLRGNLRNQCDY